MEYTDGFKTAAGFAKTAIDLMVENNIPHTPRNFAIWYAHASGREPQMSSVLETLIVGEGVSDDDNAELYSKYLGKDDEAADLQKTSERVDAAVSKVLGFIGEASDGAETYGQSLENNLGEMASADNMDSLRQAVATLVGDTKKMATQNELLHERLENSSNEINTLREHMEEVRAEGLTDGLTNIPNRKAFDITLRQEAMNAMETGEELCLLLCDIDHFKLFNDTYGHHTGDQVLKLVGMILTQNVKGRDTAARYGGEEFAIILPNTSLGAAKNLANQVREAVASKRIRKKSTGEHFGEITMSIGVAKFRGGESLSELIQRSDKGLYQAKDSGRNCVVAEDKLKEPAEG